MYITLALPEPESEPEPVLDALTDVAEAEPLVAEADPLVADAEPLVVDAELDPVADDEDAIEAGQRSTRIWEQQPKESSFLTDGLACCGAGAREGAHRSVRIATAKLGDLSLDLSCIGTADSVQVGWVWFGAISRISIGISGTDRYPLT